VHTVRSHLQRLYRTYGLSNRAEAVAAWAGQDAPPADAEALEDKLASAAEASASARLPVQCSEAPSQMELINRERDTAGLTSLDWDADLANIALLGARQMAEQGYLSTVIGAVQGGRGAEVRAENVGYWHGINDQQLHALFVADPKQRANILGTHRHIGAAWASTESGVAFLSVVFA